MFSFQPFFVPAPASSLLYEGFYDPVLVGFSVVVAILAAYAALLVSHQVSDTRTSFARRTWVILGGSCLGFGIWAMHFIGMLAFSLPCSASYDTWLTLLSMVPGILASVLAVNTISRKRLGAWPLLNGGLLIGAGVGTMHYAGMAAMRINGFIRYDAGLFLLSILVALACFALWLKFRLQANREHRPFWVTVISAVVLGLAVSGMHYTAMLAAYFVRDDTVLQDAGLQPSLLAAMVMLISGLIILATIFATFVELPSLRSFRRSLRVISMLTLAWFAMAWLGVDNYYSRLSQQYYQQESELAGRQIDHPIFLS